jgi:hypothetical protein
MRVLLLIPVAAILVACGSAGAGVSRSMTEEELEAFLRGRTVSGEFVVALKKRTLGEVAYLATVHGFPNNISVCEELIKPYNEDSSMSTLAGEYFCEELR